MVIAAPHKSKLRPWKGLLVPVRVRVRLVFAGVEVFALGASLVMEGETSVMMNEWTGKKKKRKRKSTTRRSRDEDDTEIMNLR